MRAAFVLGTFGTGTIFEAAGGAGRILTGLVGVLPGIAVAGPAFTVTAAADDSLAVHQAVAACPSGHVLVVATGGDSSSAIWGEILTAAAKARGVAGMVTDGLVRDVAGIREASFPVFARGTTPRGPGRSTPGRIGGTAFLLGVSVDQGDHVVADDDGVVVIPIASLGPTLAAAEERHRREREILDQVAAGVTTVQLLGLE